MGRVFMFVMGGHFFLVTMPAVAGIFFPWARNYIDGIRSQLCTKIQGRADQ